MAKKDLITAINTDNVQSDEDLDREIEAARQRTELLLKLKKDRQEATRKAALQAVVDFMNEHNTTLEDIAAFLGKPLATRGTKAKGEKKKSSYVDLYFNPANPDEKWNGHGHIKPWAKPYLITAEGVTPRKYKPEIHIKPV